MDAAGSGFIANPQLDEALQQQLKGMQSLPPPQAQDIERFNDVHQGVTGEAPTPLTYGDQGSPILQLIGSEQQDGLNLKEALVNRLSSMDASYHSVMEQLVDKPSFSDYLDRSMGADQGDDIRTYPSVSEKPAGDDIKSHLDNTLSEMKETQSAAVEYRRDMSGWFFNTQVWATGVTVMSSAAKQVSTAFQTLFRASG